MNDTRRADEVEPAAGYLDDEFARFRAERLAKRAASRGTATAEPVAPAPEATAAPEAMPASQPEVPVAEPPAAPGAVTAVSEPAAASDEPREGYLEDDFARFRTERLRTKSGRLTRPGEAGPAAEGGEDLFFGTSSNERRLNRIVSEAAREDVSDLPPAPPADPAEPRQAG